MTTTHRYKAAVIIPSRGGADILHYPLDALAAQTEKDFQVIVVLDGDIDNSEAVLDRYIAEGKLNLTKIVFEENRGRVAALNAGHRAADADVLIRCDDDLEPAADYVEARIRLHRDYDGVIGTLKNVYPDTPYSRSISAEYFERTGGYDPAYRLYGWEDVDMGKMVHDAGGRIIISDEVEVKHYAEATTTAVRALRALHSGSARTIFVRKHGEEAHPAPNPTGPWGFLVKTLARFTTENTIKALGDASDKILLKLPAKAAEKLVALQVEAASYAGIHYPERAQKVF